MGKISNLCYIGTCLLLCMIPSVGMAGFRSDTTTENRTLAECPKIREAGKWNSNYLEELGAYFKDHFAFRTYLVNADSEIQSKVFKVSNVDTVIVGQDDWLYYTSTLEDYLGKETLSERGKYNVVHNLELLQNYVESKGCQFVFTIPPNKNSLYGEYMPYYMQKKASNRKNMTDLQDELENDTLSYVNLFQVFQNEKETLYLKRDSHWNEKGAALAYNAILDGAGIEHERYETVKAIRTKMEYGDLNKMLYPVSAKPEWNYRYDYCRNYTYVTETQSVEEAWIETENPNGTGSLLMFRDSFGNTLLPFMANHFSKAYFSKDMPYDIERYMNEYQPELVVAEKVERNVDEFAKTPPILTGPTVTLDSEVSQLQTDTTLDIQETDSNTAYWSIYGELAKDCQEDNVKVYIGITQDGSQKVYEAFTVTKETSDYGYLLYMPKEMLFGEVTFEVFTVTEDAVCSVHKEVITIEDDLQ